MNFNTRSSREESEVDAMRMEDIGYGPISVDMGAIIYISTLGYDELRSKDDWLLTICRRLSEGVGML